MKLIKIRFTVWGDKRAAPRSPAIQQVLDDWTARISSLLVAPARIKEQLAHADSEALQKAHARITADLQTIDAARTPLLADEDDAARAAGEHKKVGTFGYQVWNDEGTQLTKVLNEAGNDLPT